MRLISYLLSIFIIGAEFSPTTHAQVKHSEYIQSFNTLFSHYSLEKKKLYQNAADGLLQLNFFHKGRGMMISPGLINMFNAAPNFLKKKSISEDYGFNFVDNKTIGLFSMDFKKYKVGVLGCVACHSGQAAGYFIVGLGNKNIDVQKIGSDAVLVEKTWGVLNALRYQTDAKYRDLTDFALDFAKTLSHPSISNETQGMVPTGIIQTWFYKQAQLPIPKLMRAAVKVPALWGYETKRKAGQFSDGLGDGSQPGWGIAVELTAGQSPEHIMEIMDKVSHAEDSFHHFLPPKYPFKINQVSAAKGKVLFVQTCQKCHGIYEQNSHGEPIFLEPKWIPHHVVKTDSERLDSVSETFLNLVDNNPLNSIMRSKYRGKGFFAPRLEGIWARFPYLHNASVPTVWDLLQPVTERPIRFELKNAGTKEKFDQKHLGLKVEREIILKENPKNRSLYDTHKMGHSNVGHEFGVKMSVQDKINIIEYLKTL